MWLREKFMWNYFLRFMF